MLELSGMYTATQSAHADGMFQVKHLVVEQIFDGITGTGWPIENAADHDGVVCGIVVTQGSPGHVLTPRKLGAAQQTSEEPQIEGIEHFFEVVEAAFRSGKALAAARPAD